MTQIFTKDPDATLDYWFDWSDYLPVGQIITSCSVVADSGLTVENFSHTSASVVVWLSGGSILKTYDVKCHILTSGSLLDDRTMYINVIQK